MQAERTKKSQAKKSLKAQVKPVEGLLMEAITAERNMLKEELATLPLNYETKEESIKSYLMAQQMHLRFLDSFQTRMLNRLRIQKDQTMNDKQWYSQYQDELNAEQDDKAPEEVEQMLKAKERRPRPAGYTHVFNPTNLPAQGHRWVDRGAKMSCEHAGHPHHAAFKRGVRCHKADGARYL
jgi:hypothetical protein